jgi:transcriptional regulator with XRE-family HTH domain
MQSLSQLRKKPGLKQEEMASLLGTSRSRLSHAEAGRRLLEAPAMEQFALLLKMANEASIPAGDDQCSDEATERIAFFLSDITHRLTALTRQHKKQSGRQGQSHLLSHCIGHLSDVKQTVAFTKKQKRWLEELHFISHKKKQRFIELSFFPELEIKTLQYQKQLTETFLQTGRFPEE